MPGDAALNARDQAARRTIVDSTGILVGMDNIWQGRSLAG
jgi:hypothetical protein